MDKLINCDFHRLYEILNYPEFGDLKMARAFIKVIPTYFEMYDSGCSTKLWTVTVLQIFEVFPNHYSMLTFPDHFGYAKLLCSDLISKYTGGGHISKL